MPTGLQKELSNNAEEFSAALRKLAVAIDADISSCVRNTMLRAFSGVIKRSPVRSGAYRGSHGISNAIPGDNDGVVKAKGKEKVPAATAKGWSWKVGDGTIWLYNNLPYAERIENGWSGQAPQGVYKLVIPEITTFLNSELAKCSSLAPIGGGGE